MPQLKSLRWYLEVVPVAAFGFAGVEEAEEEEVQGREES